MRWTLENALYEALEGKVEVRFGRWLVAASPGKHDGYFTNYRELLARLIERGIAQGELGDIDAIAITPMALFAGLALLFFVDPEASQ